MLLRCLCFYAVRVVISVIALVPVATFAAVSLVDHKIIYKGQLSKADNAKVIALYEAAKIKPTLLEITSGGGQVVLGLDLADFILAKQLDVSVPQFCFSSCANYIFVAGKTKYLGEKAVIGWHGNANSARWRDADIDREVAHLTGEAKQREWKRLRKLYNQVIAEAIDREKILFKRLSLQPELLTIGHQKELIALARKKGFRGWTVSLEVLAKLGVTHIQFLGQPWQPRSPKNFPLLIIGNIDDQDVN